MDAPLHGRRERDLLARWSPHQAMGIAPNPRGPNPEYQARLTWADVEWLMKTTKLPVGLQGVMTPRDARRAVDLGVRLIWISNHGGRQLNHTQSTIDALPPIVDAVAGAPDVVVDGSSARGTRRAGGIGAGSDGSGGGPDGAMEPLRRQRRWRRPRSRDPARRGPQTMGLCGRTSIADLAPDLIFRID